MEILNENPAPQQRHKQGYPKKSDPSTTGNIYLGVILILAGLLWLSYNFRWISYGVFDVIFSWQMLLTLIGGYLLAIRKWTAGIIVGGIGMLFLMIEVLDIHVSLSKVILPVIIMAIGIGLIISRLGKRS